MIPGSERSAGEGIGYPHQHSWAPLVDQLVNNLPAMQQTWFRSLGWEDALETGKFTHSSILAWKIQSMGSQRVGHEGATFTFTFERLQETLELTPKNMSFSSWGTGTQR